MEPLLPKDNDGPESSQSYSILGPRPFRVLAIGLLGGMAIVFSLIIMVWSGHTGTLKKTPFPHAGVYLGDVIVDGVQMTLRIDAVPAGPDRLEFSFMMDEPAKVHCAQGNSLQKGPKGGADLTLGKCVFRQFKANQIALKGFVVPNRRAMEFAFEVMDWSSTSGAVPILIPIKVILQQPQTPPSS